MFSRAAAFFANPARQALAWSALGILGMGLAAAGLLLFTSGGSAPAAAVLASPTDGPTPTPIRTPTASPTATATATQSPSPTPTPTVAARAAGAGQDAAGGSTPAPTLAPAPTPVPTEPPVVAGGPYCPGVSAAAPPNTVIGHFTIGGAPAPLGTAVTLAFDGVPGPTGNSGTAAGGYHIDYAAGGSDCANRVGAVITVIYDGTTYPTGHKVGDSPGAPVIADIVAP